MRTARGGLFLLRLAVRFMDLVVHCCEFFFTQKEEIYLELAEYYNIVVTWVVAGGCDQK